MVQDAEKKGSPGEILRDVRAALCVAKEVGYVLGHGKILLGAVSAQSVFPPWQLRGDGILI